MIQEGKTKFKFLFNVYHQNSDDGNQVYDDSGREEANVIEPMLFIEHQIDETTNINGHFVFDAWTAASDTKLDAQTGASGEGIGGQSRVSGNLGITKEISKTTIGAGVGYSSEYDYKSLNAKFNISQSFAKDNFTLGLGLQYYNDSVRLFEDLTPKEDAKISEFKSRKITAINLQASQILTRRDIAQISFDYVKASKNLESTASSILLNNTREVEKLPDNRERYAITGKWVHALSEESAINFSHRYYFDQWDLDANTTRIAYLKEINDNEDFIELSLRYHNQSKVDFYQESFTQEQKFMTSDSDLEDFKSYEIGLFHSLNLDDLELHKIEFEEITWTNGFTYSKRSNGLYLAYIQSAIGFTF